MPVHESVVPPAHVPPAHVSPYVHAFPSSQAPVMGIDAHVAVPLHVRVMHGVLVHVTVVPPQLPVESHVSEWVHAFPSSQLPPGVGVTVHVDVPLQVRVAHAELVQVTAVPPQVPPAPQMSP